MTSGCGCLSQKRSATSSCHHKSSSLVTQMRIWEHKEVLNREKLSSCFLKWQEAALFCFQQVASRHFSMTVDQLPEQCHQQILLPPSPVLKPKSALYKHLIVPLQLPLFANYCFFCSSPPLHHSLHSTFPLLLQAEAPSGEIFLIRHLGKVKAILG